MSVNRSLTLRRIGAGLVATAVAISLSACSAGGSGSGDSGAADDAATVTVGMAASPAGLDFTTSGGAAIFQALAGNVYEGLVKLDDKGQIQPLLATDWKVSDDGLRYSFTLHDGVKFHDGTAFDADVVKASLERVPQWKANTPSNLAAIDHVEVVSPTQADVVLSKPDSDLLFWLTTVLGSMIAPNSVATMSTTANGTGPYTFVSYEPGVKMKLKRNDSYWGTPAKNAEVDLAYYADASAAANSLRTGETDALFQAEAYDQIDALKSDSKYTVTEGSTQSVVVMPMNEANPALKDVRVRQAITHAIDKDAVLAAATSGHGTVLNGPSVPTDAWFEEFGEAGKHDPDQAEQLLREAGVSDLSLTFTVPNRPYAQAAAQVIQSNLSEVGIKVNLEVQEFPAVWVEKTMTGKNYDLTVTNHIEAHNMTNFGNPKYYWSYDNADVQSAFAEAKAATDDSAKTAAMKKAQQQIVDDAAAVWLYNTPNIVATKASVTGLPTDYYGAGIDFSQVTVSK